MKILSKLLTSCLVLLQAMGVLAAYGKDSQPNVILVLIDDMGWADLSCFGNTEAQTPNIDRMASEGIAFEQFYVNSPICSPSRVAFSTGTYPQRWKIASFLSYRGANKKRGMAQWLDPKAPMLARSFKENGYRTGHFGKWHMGGQRDVQDAPSISEYGFDASLTNFEGMGPKLLPLTKKPNGAEGRLWEEALNLGGPATWMQRYEITSGYIAAAIEFMDQAQASDQPFYINLWPDDVHSPFFPPIDKWGNGSKRQLYLGVLEAMDAQLAALFQYVKSSDQLRDNTIILICSDNGHEPGAGRSDPFRGNKAQLYEGGLRSPLIVWAPGLMESQAIGTRNKRSVFSAIDLSPSLLKLAKVNIPDASVYDGEDVSTVLVGQSEQSRQAPLFFSRPPLMKPSKMPALAVREGPWKLLCDFDGANGQLYNLEADPAESTNIVDTNPELAERLTKQLLQWSESIPLESPDNIATK